MIYLLRQYLEAHLAPQETVLGLSYTETGMTALHNASHALKMQW